MESYKVKPGYVLREIAEEYLAVPVGTGGEIVILNPVSKLLWERMQAPQTLDELTAAGQLFAPDAYADHAFDFKNRSNVVKALCLHVAHT